MIQKALLEHAKTILNISKQCFGEGYHSIKEIEKWIKSNSITLVVIENNEVVAFCISHFINSNQNESKLEKDASINYPYALIKTLAVAEKWQNKGFGRKLLTESIKKSKSLNVNEIYYHLWQESAHPKFTNTLESIGFQKHKVIQNYWKQESLQKDFYCKICKTPPCTCTLAIYAIKNN